MEYPAIQQYNKLWNDGSFIKPIVILIGGYCGTGKSTLAKKLQTYFPKSTTLPTGIVRSILKQSISQHDNPALYEHTYNLDKILLPGVNVIGNFTAQAKPVCESIHHIIDFIESEGQRYIIDGNHVLPSEVFERSDIIVIDLYLKVSDENQHYIMMSGPTHQRRLTEKQFETGRSIQDFILAQAAEFNRPVFEYTEALEKSLELIEKRLTVELQESVSLTKMS